MSKRQRLLLVIISFLFVPACISLGVGVGHIGSSLINFVSGDSEPPPTWRTLGQPPGEIAELLAVRTETVYVQTVDDTIYACYADWYRQPKQDCWYIVDFVPPDELGVGPDPPYEPLPPMPEGVVDEIIMHYYINSPAWESSHVYAYLRIDDGTVMQWISDPITIWSPSGLQRMAMCFLGLLGAMGGVFLMFGAIYVAIFGISRRPT
jgi:hypothetical protein